MSECLEKQGIELIRINCSVNFSLLQRVLRKLIKIGVRKTLQIERESSYLKMVADSAIKQLAGQEFDIIFVAGSLPVSFLKSDKPIVFFTDATYDCLASLYVGEEALLRRSIYQGNRAEEAAIHNASLVFYTSEWAKQNAITRYKADAGKIKLVRFGPNLPCKTTDAQLQHLIESRSNRIRKNFLFIGVDWDRKGAALAVEIISKLNEAGLPSTLTIVGCNPPGHFLLPSFVRHYSYISKADEGGIRLLENLFKSADFFILPTQADCTPVVFSEAAAYGLPVITTDVGGCRSVVLNGVTGYCIRRENFVQEAKLKILSLCRNKEQYAGFCMNAYEVYKKELNWDMIGKKIIEAFHEILPATRNPLN